ncbi:MAG TPA: M48 family metallopeptidase [Candidatus Sulfotelmatobacter sp.]|nr:M48 family metallopeptidase [Candidatus Sulfotelmatobacter sp.]
MKRSAAFLVVLLVALAALYFSQRRPHPIAVSANAVVDMVADAQRDLTRAPMRFTRLSDEEEITIGNELAQRYAVTMELTAQEQAYERYIQRVGLTLGQHTHRHLPYSFHLVPDRNLMNAFSLPGGHVYVGEGLLDILTSEDQLAFLLGHELEHIDHYHCVERVQLEARLKNLQLDVVGALVQIPLQVWEAGYTKDEELEADREGMHLAVVAGYSPYGAVSLFEKCAKLHDEYVIHARSPEQELSELAMQSLEGYFRSHPMPSERLAQANSVIAQNGWKDRTNQKPFRIEYEVHNGEYVK